MHESTGGYEIKNIRQVAAFDIDRRKVGHPLHKAGFSKPNCTTIFEKTLPDFDVIVQMSPVLDGFPEHMHNYPEEQASQPGECEPVDVAEALVRAEAQILLCYLPVGAEQAVKHYADACLEAGVAMVNCVPVFIASDPNYAERFRERGLPIIGDDIKSQCDNMKMCAFSTGNSPTIAPSCGRPSPMIREHGRLNTQEVTMVFALFR